MANTIIIKHSDTGGSKPAIGDLERGELAINIIDGIIYFEKGASGSEEVVSIGHGALRDIGNYVKDMTPPTVDQTNTGYFFNVISDITGDATYGDMYEGDWVISTGSGWAHWKNSTKHLSGVTGGYAPLDGSQKIPVSYLPDDIVGGMTYKGSWDAANNNPDLHNTANQSNGWYYIVSTDGTTDLDGITDWKVGDWAVFTDDGSASGWEKIDNTQSSVNASQVAFTAYGDISSTTVQAAIQELDDEKQADLGSGTANQVLKTNDAGDAIDWETQTADDVISTAIAGASTVEQAIANLSPRAHTYTITDGTSPDAALGSDGDLCSVTDNTDVANSEMYQKINGAWVLFTSGSGGVTDFIGLSDTPADYTAKANQLVFVNNGDGTDGSALEFRDTIDGGTF